MVAQQSEDTSVRKLFKAIELFRTVDATIPAQTIACFLAIAQKEGENINSIAAKVDMPQSAASRNISSLTSWDWRKKPGLKLVEYREDPMNLAQKPLFLTDKGKNLIHKLADALGGH